MNAVSTEVVQVPYSTMERMAQAVAKSGLFNVRTPEQAMSLMLLAASENVHPARAMQEYHVIQNRPALRADAMLARFQAAGGRVQWEKHTDEEVVGVFSHPAGGTIRIDWTMDRAKRAGLGTKDNWRSYPRQMLRARCISEGVRATFPGIAVGTYTVEEAQDMPPVDVTPEKADEAAAPQSASARPLTDEEAMEHLVAIRDAAPGEPLRAAFAAAWKHARDARDTHAQAEFQAAYDVRKASSVVVEVTP